MHRLKLVLHWLLGLLFVAAGVGHFLRTDFYVAIMPPYLPSHRELVYLSGICEMFLGPHSCSCRRWQVPAAWGLVALLVAVFPANVHMAVHAEQFPTFNRTVLWLRLPLQGVLIVWAYWLRASGPIATWEQAA